MAAVWVITTSATTAANGARSFSADHERPLKPKCGAPVWIVPSTATPWGPPLLEMDVVLIYSVIVFALWHAPIYMWMLVVSGAVRRATFLWAVLPPLAIAAVEKMVFNTSYFGSLLLNRLVGVVSAFHLIDKNGVALDPHFIPLALLAPRQFLSNPSLWLGLIVAAIFFAVAVRLRRYQGAL